MLGSCYRIQEPGTVDLSEVVLLRTADKASFVPVTGGSQGGFCIVDFWLESQDRDLPTEVTRAGVPQRNLRCSQKESVKTKLQQVKIDREKPKFQSQVKQRVDSEIIRQEASFSRIFFCHSSGGRIRTVAGQGQGHLSERIQV